MDVVNVGSSVFTKLWTQLFIASNYQYPFYQSWNIEYYKTVFRDSGFEDCSFVIAEKDKALVGIRMALGTSPEGNRELSFFRLPMLCVEDQNIDQNQLRTAYKLLKAEFEKKLETESVTVVIYQDFLNKGELSVIGRYLLDKGALVVPYFTQVIDLTIPEADLHRSIRKSYKSLVNWGKKNLKLKILDSEAIALEDLENFRKLHFHSAGRQTRSFDTWHLQYKMVCHKEAFVILGELEGELVTAAFFPCSPRSCYYGVSASRRELFDKPLSHAVIWSAMLYAKQQGCRFFELGEQLYPGHGHPTQKEVNISTFKHGFGGETQVRLNIKWER
tara:strand:- start:784 stop:1776 length:993 start_codon:yes stop_codon:yes gene_type:complete